MLINKEMSLFFQICYDILNLKKKNDNMTYTNNNNISKMSTSKIIEVLTNSYSKLILQNLALKLMPTVMLWGPPGVGKSQAVYEMAKGIEKQTLKKVNVTDVRLILFNPIDLRGIPTSDSNKEFSI